MVTYQVKFKGFTILKQGGDQIVINSPHSLDSDLGTHRREYLVKVSKTGLTYVVAPNHKEMDKHESKTK